MEHNKIIFFLQLLFNLSETSTLIEMAATVAHSAYKMELVTSVVWWRADTTDNVTQFLEKFHGSTVLTAIDNKNTTHILGLNKKVGYRQTVFFASAPEEFECFLQQLSKVLIIPIRVILIITTALNNQSDLSGYTQVSWKYDVADIIILNTDNTGDVEISTYFPYSEGVCGNINPVQFNLDLSENMFPRKFTNFHECPIKVTLLHFLPYVILDIENGTITSVTGIDGSVLMYAIEKLNASIDVVSSTDHGGIGTYINGTGTGSFGDLVNRIADVFAPAGVITSARYSAAQISYVYETLDVYWCGPNRREIYKWAKVIMPFFNNTTPFLCLSFVVFVLVTMFFKRTGLHKTVMRDSVLFQSFVIFLGVEVKFESKSALINSLYVLWIWFCMIVRIIYQGDLVDGLQKIILEPHFISLLDAVKAVDGYGGVEVFREYYKNTSLETGYKTLSLPDIPLYINEISDGKRFLLATDILLVKYFRQKMQVLDEPISRAATCIYMRAGWPASHEINTVIKRVIETGLLEKRLKGIRRGWAESAGTEDQATKALGMSTLSALFYGLATLKCLCVFVFIIEIIYFKVKRNKSKLI